jgi:hypothetical protein
MLENILRNIQRVKILNKAVLLVISKNLVFKNSRFFIQKLVDFLEKRVEIDHIPYEVELSSYGFSNFPI